MGVQNPLDSQLLAFSLLLVNTPARRHKLGCLFLSVLIFVRASTLRLADLRALVPSALVAFILSRIGYLIPNRQDYTSHVCSSTQDSISYSPNHIENGCTGSTIVIQYHASVLPRFGIEGMNSWRYHDLISTLTET